MNTVSLVCMFMDMQYARNPYRVMGYHILKDMCNQRVDQIYWYQPQNYFAHLVVEKSFDYFKQKNGF